MKILRALIPHLAIALNISMLVVVYLDLRNPMMGFLVGAPFLVLVGASCIFSIVSAVMLYAGLRGKRPHKNEIKN